MEQLPLWDETRWLWTERYGKSLRGKVCEIAKAELTHLR
jgi:hypothetical protein